MGRPGRIIGLIALVCGAVTLAAVTLPIVQFAYRSAVVHVIIATAGCVVAVLAAFLVFGRVKRSVRLNDLLLACGLSLLAMAAAVLAVLPAFAGRDVQISLDWDGRIFKLFGAALLAASVLAATRGRLKRPDLVGKIVLGGALSLVLPTAIVVWLVRGRLPAVVLVAIVRANWPDLDAPGSVLILAAITSALFAVAAYGFLRQAERRGDTFLVWIAAASVLAAFSSFNYVLYPSRSSGWVYTGDDFAFLANLVLFMGAMHEIRSYWRSVPYLRVLEERRRMARDLHDGLAQEIAYIARNLRQLEPLQGERGDRLSRLQHAAERAELEARRALAALSTPTDEPVEMLLQRAVVDVADRFGAEVDVDLAVGVSISPTRVESLLRIACEAVANAARHSGETRLAVSLERIGDRVRLRVRDYGRGFDSTAPTSGFGLISMRERAQAAGGRLAIESVPGRGTTVEVTL